MSRAGSSSRQQPFTSTGIEGLDDILRGGYPTGRITLVRGASGTGKTILSLLFACDPLHEPSPAVFATFDESPEHLRAYTRALNMNTEVTFLDFRPDPETPATGGPIELGGLLARIEHASKQSAANRLVLDALDNLFERWENNLLVRRDLYRLFEWCRSRGITVLATVGENSGYRASTGLMDYASDCTVFLQQRMDNGLMTRTLRILKRRGAGHGTNEFPYLIDGGGISVMPVTRSSIVAKASRRRMSTGMTQLDDMLGGKGVWEGSTVMISGQSGTGKSLLSTTMAAAACDRGHSVVMFSFEEGPDQIVRDVRSIGLSLRPHLRSGKLKIQSQRPVERGLEEHIINLIYRVKEMQPALVIFDPINSLADLGDARAFKGMVLRLCQFLANAGVTTILTELLPDDAKVGSSLNISSVIDTWIRLRRVERNGELYRIIHVHKSRGTATSNRVRRLRMTRKGIVIDEPDQPRQPREGR